MSEEMPDTEQEQPKSKVRNTLDYVVDIVTVLILGALVYFGKIDSSLGLAIIAFIAGAKLPSKGGGVVTMLAPLLSFMSNGALKL